MSSTALSLSATTSSHSVSKQLPFAVLGSGTILASVAANALLYFLGNTVVAYDPEFLPLANVSGAIIFTVTLRWRGAAVAALRRFTRQPARIFSVISAITRRQRSFRDFTYIPTVPGSTTAQTAVLVMMHVIAALVIVRMLTSSSDRSAAR